MGRASVSCRLCPYTAREGPLCPVRRLGGKDSGRGGGKVRKKKGRRVCFF